MDLIYFTLYCFIVIGIIYCINEFYQIRRKLEDNVRQIKQHQKLLLELQKYIEHTKISEPIKESI
jgi:cell division protein FtsL